MKKGFTLAEVLITLGIIGVVAAMTIPNLITHNQKEETVTKLRRAISVFNQAYKLSFDELGNPTPEEAFAMGPEEYIKTYWEKNKKINHICLKYSDCGYESLTPMTFANGEKNTSNIINKTSRIGITTMDGFTYIIFTSSWNNDTNSFSNPNSLVIVDINGSHKPNKLGKDIFYLTRVEDKGVFPECYNCKRDYIEKDCSSYGIYCAEKIRRAGWKIEKDYPW